MDMKIKLPTLYKKTSTGAIQFWDIESYTQIGQMNEEEFAPEWGVIKTEYGQLGTDSPQKTFDTISEGKNIGKKNETSAIEQAAKEAKARWEKQKKKGYVESVDAAEKEELDELIQGGIVPMLAHSYSKQGHKIKYSAYIQPKLDGIRCISVLKDGKCTLWTRTRKLITGVPHIARAIENAFSNLPKGHQIVLDGELYNHDFKNDFEKIVSYVRQEAPAEGHEVVQYHIYDIVNDKKFSSRATSMRYIKSSWFPNNEVIKVETALVEDEAQAMEYFERWRKEGYEGAMIRNADGLYVNKRSYDLQKIKEFDDAEFEIVGAEEGRGRLAGHVGAFVCRMADGKQFLAKMSGNTEKLAEYFNNPDLYLGKKAYSKIPGTNRDKRSP